METLSQASELILKAEDELKALMSQAAKKGEYDAVVVLAEWARTLSELLTRPATAAPVSDSSDQAIPKGIPSGIALTAHRRRPAGRTAVRGKQRANYPRFLRDGDNLVKVAWSKSSKCEYEHKAPKSVVVTLARTLKKFSTGNQLFSTETALPQVDDEGSQIPLYQSYVGLAWFRQSELVIQHGRQGYSLQRGIDIEGAALAAWEKLPQRRGAR
jgi:hypothetical protein